MLTGQEYKNLMNETDTVINELLAVKNLNKIIDEDTKHLIDLSAKLLRKQSEVIEEYVGELELSY